MNRVLKRGGVVLAALLCIGLVSPEHAATSEAEARKLLVDSEAKHRSKSQEYAGELVVISKDGKERRKSWRSYREGYAGDAKQLIRFTSPPEVRGVGYLSLPRPGKTPDQWLYLPSMKRERRIASQDRESSFVGTDFNYEDMEEFDHARYEVDLLPDQVVDGQVCWMIEVRPKEKSLYDRRVLALRKDILLLTRAEYFRSGEREAAKRFVLSDIAQVDGRWVARKMEMTDMRKGSRTIVTLKEIGIDRPQPADRFTIQNLLREE